MTKLAYWNQTEYDLALHRIRQPRTLQLAIDFTTLHHVLVNSPLFIYKARRIYEGGDIFTSHQLDPEERLSVVYAYDESLIDVELASPAIRETGFTKINYYWYRPGVWVDWLKIQDDPTQYRILSEKALDGDQAYKIKFGSRLSFHSLFITFSQLLGITLTPQNPQAPEASIGSLADDSLDFTIHFSAFFKKWMRNHQKPYRPGDPYPLEITAVFHSEFPIGETHVTDPPFEPPVYDGLVDHRHGNPFLRVPSTEPESRVILRASSPLLLTPDMVPSLKTSP